MLLYNILYFHVLVCLFQTQLPNGTYKQHSIDEEFSVVLTSYDGVFRIEVPYNNLILENCIPSISYEFLPQSYACSGKLLLCSNERRHED